MKDWKDKAYEMFFSDGLEINEIAILLEKSRRSIQGYLSTCEVYEQKRKEYKRQWDRDNRSKSDTVTAESMRREHDIAAMILSHEKY